MTRDLLVSFCLLSAVTVTATSTGGKTVIVDGGDGSGLPAASVFNRGGTMLGISSDDGTFPPVADGEYPLTVRYLGYDAVTVDTPSDTIRLWPRSTELAEVEVKKQVDGVTVLCYAREYGSAIAGDTINVFTEYMVDYLLPLGKAKGFKSRNHPRILRRRSVGRVARADGTDSIGRDMENIMLSWLDVTDIDKNGFTEPQSLRDCKTGSDSLKERKFQTFYRKTPVSLTRTRDYLSDKKGHTWSPWFFKLFGVTMDITTMWESSVYPISESGEYHSFHFSTWSYAIGALGKGKWLKKAFRTDSPIRMNSLIEIYPVRYEFISAEESKDLKKEKPQVDWEIPDNVPPLDPATLALTERCSRIP